MQLDDNLKELIQELGNAINVSIRDSERISEAIQKVKDAGYDVFLVLEATIGYNKREAEVAANVPAGLESGDLHLKVTAQDLNFLRSLKISVEDLDQK